MESQFDSHAVDSHTSSRQDEEEICCFASSSGTCPVVSHHTDAHSSVGSPDSLGLHFLFEESPESIEDDSIFASSLDLAQVSHASSGSLDSIYLSAESFVSHDSSDYFSAKSLVSPHSSDSVDSIYFSAESLETVGTVNEIESLPDTINEIESLPDSPRTSNAQEISLDSEVVPASPATHAQLTATKTIYWALLLLSGLLMGYENGIPDPLVAETNFSADIMYHIYEKNHVYKVDDYCQYNNLTQRLLIGISAVMSLVMVPLTLPASLKWGTKRVLQIGCISYFIGEIVSACSLNLPMFIIARVLVGIGLGLYIQVTPLLQSEILGSEKKHKFFSVLATSVGTMVATLVVQDIDYDRNRWRIVIAVGFIPNFLVFILSFLVCDTPTNLILRQKLGAVRESLEKIRGRRDVDEEYEELLVNISSSRGVKKQFRNIWIFPSRPSFYISLLQVLFQQIVGISMISFVSPVVLRTIGVGNLRYVSPIISLFVVIIGTQFSFYMIAKRGRRMTIMVFCVGMLIFELMVGVIMQYYRPYKLMEHIGIAWLVTVLIALYTFCFSISTGPLDWLEHGFHPKSSIFGTFILTSFNMGISVVVAQFSLYLVCGLRSWTFVVYALLALGMSVTIYLFVPETSNIPSFDELDRVWRTHWYWKKYTSDEHIEI